MEYPQTPISRWRAWLPLTFVVLGIAILAARQIRPLTDPDVWWHLRLGSEFRGGWSLANPGSLTPFATADWVPTQWSLEVLASWLVDRLGLASVVWLSAVAVIALGAVMWRGNRRFASPLPAAIATGLALAGTLQVLAPRPQLASLVLLAVVSNAWWRTAEDARPRWWLIAVTWVWACTHGFWFVGVGLGLVVLAGMWADRRVTRAQTGRLLLVPLGSLVAAALTPVGPRLLLAPLRVSGVAQFIQEWQPPNFQSPYALFVLAMAVVVIVHLSRRQGSWTQVLVLVFALVLLVYAARTVALAAVVLAPLTAAALQALLPTQVGSPDRRETLLLGLGVTASVLLVSLLAVLRAPLAPPYPDLTAVVADLPDGVVVYNQYRLGGWLAYEHPAVIHGVDGLTESFTADYLRAYFDAGVLRPGWQELVDDRVGADVVLVSRDAPMAEALRTGGWTSLAEEDGFVVLGRSAAVAD